MPVSGLPSHPSTRTARRATPVVPALLAALLLTAGCTWVDKTTLVVEDEAVEQTPLEPAQFPPADLPGADEASTALRALPRVDRRPTGLPAYERRAFGSSWSDVDGNGCNQRDDVLLRDAEPGTTRTQQQGRCDHDVLAGTWTDPYSGRVLALDDLKDQQQAQAVQIDHVVPLAEAWRSGAWAWNEARRREFANTLDVLLAVDGPTNAAKSDDDPAAWRPRRSFQCTYALRWVDVKYAWQLAVDDSERAALDEMLATCPTS